MDVGPLVEQVPDRPGDFGGAERRCRYLIEQGLEQVMVASVDDGYVGVNAVEFVDRGETAKTAAHHHYPWLCLRSHFRLLRCPHHKWSSAKGGSIASPSASAMLPPQGGLA